MAINSQIPGLLRVQSVWCARLGSPLYADLLDRCANDFEAKGPCWELLRPHEDDLPGSVLPLRFMGAVHRLVLDGAVPELARFYPSAGGKVGDADPWPTFIKAVQEQMKPLKDLVVRPVQTNEVGRSAALIGGFLLVAKKWGLPLRILEIGASAGLNLLWDKYGYRAGPLRWGDQDAPLQFEDVYEGQPPFEVEAVVAERRGCDLQPINVRTEEGRLTLKSFVWPDQVDRFRLLDAAIGVTAQHAIKVEKADGASWANARLSERKSGFATVLFHSIVMQYLNDESRNSLTKTIQTTGESATDDEPFAWLRLEGYQDKFGVYLTTWPKGEEAVVAIAGPHGKPVEWKGL